MARAPDILGVVEVAYRSDIEDAAWLSAVCSEVRRALGAPLGCAGFTIDASDLASVKIDRVEQSELAVGIEPRAFVPANEEEARPYYGGAAVAGSASGQVGGADIWRSTRVYREHYRPLGVEDVIGIVAMDAQRRGCVIAVPTPEITTLVRRASLRLTRLGAHLSAALRLRRSIGAPRGTRSTREEPEAVLDPSGKLLDATGAAAERESRSELREMARRLERSRTKTRREDPDAALEVWTALVSGRWSLLDRFDSDGKRYLVAYKNAPGLVEPRALSEIERTVAAYAALGRPGKVIAYELGLSPATVSYHLHSALEKLGLSNAAELASTLASFVPPGLARPRSAAAGAEGGKGPIR